MLVKIIIVVGSFLMGYLAHEPLADQLASLRGKTRVVSYRGERRRGGGGPTGPVAYAT